jgi:hypothetical protein
MRLSSRRKRSGVDFDAKAYNIRCQNSIDVSLKTRSASPRGALRPFLFLNDRQQLADARSLSVQTARFLPRYLLISATSLLRFPLEQNMTGFNLLRPQIDTMKLLSASAPPHIRRDMILLSATFIEVKPQSFLSAGRAERRRYRLLFDIT